MRANRIQLTLNILLFSISVVALNACTSGKSAEQKLVQKLDDASLKLSESAIKNLKLEKIEEAEYPDQLSLMGKVSIPEDHMSVVQSRLAGRVDGVYVASGEVVTKGQSLALLFSPDFVIAREEFMQAYNQAKEAPQDPDAKHLLELSKKKLDSIGMSGGDIQNIRSSTGLKSENLTLRAPMSGAVIDKKAMVGLIVNPGDTLFTIGDLSKVWFAGDLYPEDISKVHKDQEVIIEAAPGRPALHGKVSFISPMIDPNTRTIKIRALMDNPGSQLRADMYVKGNLIISTKMALLAPKTALIRLRDSLFCFIRQPNNIFKRVIVKVGSESGEKAEITDGLKNGDEVVTEGALLLDAALASEENSGDSGK